MMNYLSYNPYKKIQVAVLVGLLIMTGLSHGKQNKLPIEREGIRLENPENFYTFDKDEISRDMFSVSKKVTNKKSGKVYTAKVYYFDDGTLPFTTRQYDLITSGKLKDPSLPKLHEAFLVRDNLILIMDHVAGKTLLDFVSSKHSLTEEDVASYIRQIIAILKNLHSEGVIHNDIRPTQIRFLNGRELTFTSLIAALNVSNTSKTVIDIIGDTEFVPPEALNFEPLHPGSDMWSVGVLTYILLSGISPFYDENEDLVIANVQAAKWALDEDAFATISSEAKDFINKLLVKAPEMRMTASDALNHKWLGNDYSRARKSSKLSHQDTMRETDERLYSEEEEEYIMDACLVFRTFNEDPYVCPEED